MPYLPEVTGPWGDRKMYAPWPGENNVRALEDMAQYGAKEFRAGRCDCVEFRLFGSEEIDLRRIMTEQYPDVRYIVDNPYSRRPAELL